ncbi:unnamed protein product [Rangifer tarandus platyrhynchus]|uniref:Uncharacterized protein n=1 Tax=Rangifer tarandus platyrhynchus TaxID=3082113 RepID=A0ABN8XP90_RANTA|nr:unnamed protein product [Rangifer tarandus platyrhynchus]
MPTPCLLKHLCSIRALVPGLSFFLSLSYFLIVDSGPPGSGPIKDQQVAPRNRDLVHVADSDGVTPQALLSLVSTKTWVSWLESPLTFLLYFITYLFFYKFFFKIRNCYFLYCNQRKR